MNTPTLNWKEIELLTASIASTLSPETEGVYVDRVIVPERPKFAAGYLKGEWVLRLRGRKRDFSLLFSVRPRHPYFTLLGERGPKASAAATRSPFDLALSRQLKDTRLLRVEALERERVVIFWFSGGSAGEMGLVLLMIPAVPEAILVRANDGNEGWPILTRSRTPKLNEAPEARFTPPLGANAPEAPPVRGELTASERLTPALERALEAEAFEQRLQAAMRELKGIAKHARDRIRQSGIALSEAENDENWETYGELLKARLADAPPLQSEPGPTGAVVYFRDVEDFATGEKRRVPGDPKYGAREQTERFFQLARRKARRIEESRARLAAAEEALGRVEALMATPPTSPDWAALERFERAAGRAPSASARAPRLSAGPKAGARWLGKNFTSKDGLSIWVGRSKDENLELTFKHARGNDLWLHVRGRPGAHAVIPLQPGKSAPLDTLLDAANLVVYYSGGEHWGKTEVDYTFKKYVKRIRDSTEASYVNNKTLLIEVDPMRLKRLLGAEK